MASEEIEIPTDPAKTPPILPKNETPVNLLETSVNLQETPVNLLQDSERSPSPDENCSICLNKFENKSFTDSCFHKFCFVCILEWSKVKAVCPLCKTAFKSIIHNIQSNEIYDQYHLQQNTAPDDQDSRRFRYRTTVTDDHRYAWEQNNTLLRHEARIRIREQRIQNQINVAYNYRRYIYSSGSHVMKTHTSRLSISRDISLEFFHRNPATVYRLVPWLQRDLSVILNGDQNHVMFVTDLILSLILRVDIQSQEFFNSLQGFFLTRTKHFIHELIHFAQSPYDMEAYDKVAQYSRPNEIGLLLISSDSENDVDIIPQSPIDLSAHPRAESSTALTPIPRVESDITPGTSSTSSHALYVKQEKNTDKNVKVMVTNDPSDSDVEIIGYLKPFHERTPEVVVLSSDTDGGQPACRKCGQPKHASKCKKIKRKPKSKCPPSPYHSHSYSSSMSPKSNTYFDRSRSRSWSASRNNRHNSRANSCSRSRSRSPKYKQHSTSSSSLKYSGSSIDNDKYPTKQQTSHESSGKSLYRSHSRSRRSQSRTCRSLSKSRRPRSHRSQSRSHRSLSKSHRPRSHRSRSRSQSRSYRSLSRTYRSLSKSHRPRSHRSRSRSQSRSHTSKSSSCTSRSRSCRSRSRSHRSPSRSRRSQSRSHRSCSKDISYDRLISQFSDHYRYTNHMGWRIEGRRDSLWDHDHSKKHHRTSVRRSSEQSQLVSCSKSHNEKMDSRRVSRSIEERSVPENNSKKHERSRERREERCKRREKKRRLAKKREMECSDDVVVIDLTESVDEYICSKGIQQLGNEDLFFEEEVSTINQTKNHNNIAISLTCGVGPMQAGDVAESVNTMDVVAEVNNITNQPEEHVKKTVYELFIESETKRLQEMIARPHDSHI